MEAVRRWAGISALAVGIFILITIEELPIGVLSVMAPDLGVSKGAAGLTVTVPGILAGVVSLVTPVLVRGMDRRLVLVLALVSVVVSCALSVIAPNFAVLLLSRLFAGISIGLYWAVMAVVAIGQVRPEQVPTALTVAFSGAGAALVLGVPTAAWIGSHVGWRAAFAAVGIAAGVVAVLLLLLTRPVRARAVVSIPMMLAAAKVRGMRYVLAFTGLVVVGQFVTYSYVSPLLVERAHIPVTGISALLLLYGVAGLIGNFAVGALLRRSTPLGTLVVCCGIAAALLGILLLVDSPAAALVLMPVWGLFVGAVSVAFQAFISTEAADVLDEGTALNSGVFNASIAIGALIGGIVLDRAGMTPMILTSLVMVTAGAVLAARYALTAARHP